MNVLGRLFLNSRKDRVFLLDVEELTFLKIVTMGLWDFSKILSSTLIYEPILIIKKNL